MSTTNAAVKAIPSHVDAIVAMRTVKAAAKHGKKVSGPVKNVAPAKSTLPTWKDKVTLLVSEYCDTGAKLSDIVVMLKDSIKEQSRDDVRSALLVAVSAKYNVPIIPTKSVKKTDAGKLVFDAEAVNYETARKQLQRLTLAVMPADISEANEGSEETLSKKEELAEAPECQEFITAMDDLIASSGLDKKHLIAALKAQLAAYK